MMLNNAMSGWMVEGSPSRLLRDYNQLVDAYNRGPNIQAKAAPRTPKAMRGALDADWTSARRAGSRSSRAGC
jgi:hypothetical protein